MLTGQLAPPAVLTEPVVRVTLRISTTVTLVDKVEQELQRSMLNTTDSLAARLRAKGHDVTGIYIVSMTSSLVCCLTTPLTRDGAGAGTLSCFDPVMVDT